MAWSLRAEVEDAEVRDHAADLVEARGTFAERRRPVVADARDHIDLRDEGFGPVIRDPVAGRVVDGVARRAAHAEQLRARMLGIADAGDVLVAEAIDLGGAHQHVASPRPEQVEDAAIGQPALDHGLEAVRRAQRGDVVQHVVQAVRDQQVGGEAELREARAQRREHADRAGQDLAVAAEALGEGDGAQLGSRELAHRARTAAW